jgi:hypothetical protein
MSPVDRVRPVAMVGAVVALVALPGASPAGPADLAGQDMVMTSTTSINAGIMAHRLEGSGSNPFFALRTDYVVSDLSVADFAVGYGQPEQDFGRSHFMLAEGQYQIRWPVHRFAPYAGMGAGVVADSPMTDELETRWSPTFSVGAGVRAWVDDTLRVRTDLRWRGIGADFGQTSMEWTFGMGWRW